MYQCCLPGTYDTALDEGKLIHTISDTAYQSFVTIDYAPVEHCGNKKHAKKCIWKQREGNQPGSGFQEEQQPGCYRNLVQQEEEESRA